MDENLIPIVAITAPFIFVIVITVMKVTENIKRNRMRTELYSKAIEKGYDLPKDLLADPEAKVKKNKSLNTGIILISVGIGFCVFALIAVPDEARWQAAAVGLVPLFLGLGFLLIHFLSKKADHSQK